MVPRLIHTKNSKMVLDASLVNTQHYDVCIKSKGVIQEKEYRPSQHLDIETIEKGAFGSLLTTVGQLTVLILNVRVICWEIQYIYIYI